MLDIHTERHKEKNEFWGCIRFCVEPCALLPVFSERLAEAISRCGIPASFDRIGSRSFAGFIGRHRLLAKRPELFAFFNGRFFARNWLRELKRLNSAESQACVLYGTLGLLADWFPGNILSTLKKAGVRLIVLVQDAWPYAEPLHRHCLDNCLVHADAIGAVTPELAELLRKEKAGKPVFLMEEAIDTESFDPDFTANDPVLVWSGPPRKLKELVALLPILESVYQKTPFRLRVASGMSRPMLSTTIPVDWVPFYGTTRGEQFGNASIGIATYPDTPYSRCKGNYKIKTYMAAGCTVVTSPVGYNTTLVQPGENGLFAETRNEWVDALVRLLSDSALRLSMRKNARESIVARYSYDAIAKRYCNVFELLKG